MKEQLDSDRVNYLIWRYLLEANYRETALKLQQEWGIRRPHEELEYAPNVQTHALVQTLNRGLVYDDIVRRHPIAKRDPRDAAETAEASQIGVFGPLPAANEPHRVPTPYSAQQSAAQLRYVREKDAQQRAKSKEQHAAGETPKPGERSTPVLPIVQQPRDEDEVPRKRSVDEQTQLTNGHSKKPRLSNGHTPDGSTERLGHLATDAMDVDSRQQPHQQHDQDDAPRQQAYPSPQEADRVATPILKTSGPQQTTQTAKVDELAPRTTFIQLGRDGMLSPPVSSPLGLNASQGRLAANPVLLKCAWSPTDPQSLVACGTESLSRAYVIDRSAGMGSDMQDVQSSFTDLAATLPSKSTVTAIDWSRDGNTVAFATQSGLQGHINISDKDGLNPSSMVVEEPPVLKLQCNPSNNWLLSLAPEGNGVAITVINPHGGETAVHSIPEFDPVSAAIDATWVSNTDFIVGGGTMMRLLRCTPDGIKALRDFETRSNDSISQVQFDARASTDLVAAATEQGFVDVWDEQGQRRSIQAHDGPVTCLMWQPYQPDPSLNEQLIASGGEDGVVAVWNVRSADTSKPKFSYTVGPDLPIVGVAFTPDGEFLAGATSKKIMIWKVRDGEHHTLRAVWHRPPQPGWLSPADDREEEDICCLAWDATGRKLAFGVNNRLAIIDFQR